MYKRGKAKLQMPDVLPAKQLLKSQFFDKINTIRCPQQGSSSTTICGEMSCVFKVELPRSKHRTGITGLLLYCSLGQTCSMQPQQRLSLFVL